MNVCTVCGKSSAAEVCLRRDKKGRQACLISYRHFMAELEKQ